MASKTCTGPCGLSKPESDFYGKSSKCKRCTLDRQKALKAEKVGGDAPAAGKARGAQGGGSRKSRRPPVTHTSAFSRPPGLGYGLQLEVDENTKQTDIVVTQHNATAGEQRIWLNQLEAREVLSWLTEQLGA